MEQTDKQSGKTSGRAGRSPRLVRPLEGRVLAGVARGIANNFGISEWIPRLFFIVTTFMGGLGIALYAAGWVFIRSEGEAHSPAERFFAGASTSRSWLGIALIVIAGMIILGNFTFLSGEVIWAIALLVVGLLLYLDYIPGPSPSRETRLTEDGSPESKEGVQRMTDTPTATELLDEPSGDSPAGGSTTPTPTSSPAPPVRPPKPPHERSILGRLTLGATAIGLGLLAMLDNIDALAIDARPHHYLALAVTIIGLGLIVGAFAGRARWLILILALLVPPLLFTPFFGVDADPGFDLQVRPETFSELQESYQLDFGEMVIDLTQLRWNGQEVALNASVDAGSLRIVLPGDVGIAGEADVNIGDVSEVGTLLGGSPGYVDRRHLVWEEEGSRGTVLVDAHVNIGDIEIIRGG